ncbi:MAG: class I SAM-dependent methyltransferase [Desulfobacterales bacterium]|nr:class I SAM-dependent methyltransferase [Desulfobacterales bacterium]MBF0398939.1 class I SAM-dependent methyltransferase [Desulfobacterales bacterium]
MILDNSQVFGKNYGDYYDQFYYDKNYNDECDLIEKIISNHLDFQPKTILDLGCGTGNHAILLSHRNYQVTGVDQSEHMIIHAKKKALISSSDFKFQPIFIEKNFRDMDLGKEFDLVIMMFGVLGYQIKNEDLLSALKTVRLHLKPGGIFISDIWYGPAVLSIRPTDRVKVIHTDDGKIIRMGKVTLDTYLHFVEVHYNILCLKKEKLISETEEIHKMRYFFPQELAFFMMQADLQMIDICSFDNLEKKPSEETWNIVAIGKRPLK